MGGWGIEEFWWILLARFWEYYASTTIRMRNIRYLDASKTVMWYNLFCYKEEK